MNLRLVSTGIKGYQISMPTLIRFALASLGSALLTLSAGANERQGLAELVGVWRADFNSDASRVIVQMRGGQLGIWHAASGDPVPGELGTLRDRGTYILDESASMAFIGFASGKSRVFDMTSGRAVSPELDAEVRRDWPGQVFFSPDGSQVVVFDDSGPCRIFDVRSGSTVATLEFPQGSGEREIQAGVAFSKDGRSALILDAGAVLRRYDTEGWKERGKPMPHPDRNAYFCGFSASKDARFAVTFDSPGENGPSGQLQLWDTETCRPVGDPVRAKNGISARFFDSGKRLLITPGRGQTRVAEVPSLETDIALPRHDDVDASSAVLTADEKTVLTWGYDSWAKATDTGSGKVTGFHSGRAHVRGTLTGPDPSSAWLVFDNSAFTLQGHYDYYVIRLNLDDMRPAATLRITGFLHRYILSPDGLRLMIHEGRSHQERIRLFDAKTLIESPATATDGGSQHR